MELKKKIINHIKETKCVDDISINYSFESLEFDRWDMICLFDFIEDEFGVPINYDFIYIFKTVKDILDYVKQEVERRGLSCKM